MYKKLSASGGFAPLTPNQGLGKLRLATVAHLEI